MVETFKEGMIYRYGVLYIKVDVVNEVRRVIGYHYVDINDYKSMSMESNETHSFFEAGIAYMQERYSHILSDLTGESI